MEITDSQKHNFFNKVDKTDSCWNWVGYRSFGYGKVNIGGKVYLAHKISALLSGLLTNPIKKEKGASGEVVMHTCDNRGCVNPSHLIVATQKENMQDAKRKGRKWSGEQRGENNGRSLIDKNTATAIKFWVQYGLDVKTIQSMFFVPSTVVDNIKSGKAWKWLMV